MFVEAKAHPGVFVSTRSSSYAKVRGATSVEVEDRRCIGRGDMLRSLMQLVHMVSGPEVGGAFVEMTHSGVHAKAG